jgi:hypothetical protein
MIAAHTSTGPRGSHEGSDRADDGGARGAGPASRHCGSPSKGRDPKKGRGVLRGAEAMGFAFIAAKKAEHTVLGR